MKLTAQEQRRAQQAADRANPDAVRAHAEQQRSLDQAKAQIDSIKELVAALREARETDDADAIEEATTNIHEDPLSLAVRSDWYEPGQPPDKPLEYKILLCTGGPACQVIGDINDYGEPATAALQHQDWFTPWTDLPLTAGEVDVLLEYARVFYWGD